MVAMYASFGSDLQPVAIHAADGAELHAGYSLPEHQNGKAVILLHGIGDNRGGVAGYGQAFLNQGYRVLLPDSGESGGTVATYGLLESDGIHRWVSWLDGGATCVDGFGESMGAALLLESMRANPGFVRLWQSPPFPGFATSPMLANDTSRKLAGVVWRE
jgi:uncharacterized protein